MASQVFKAGSDGRVTAEYDPLTGVVEFIDPATGLPLPRGPIYMGRSNGADDSPWINAVLASAAGRTVRGMEGETYRINAALVVPTGCTLDVTGCTLQQTAGPMRNMLRNTAVAASRTICDAVVTAGSSVMSSASGSFSQSDVGKAVTVYCGDNGVPVFLRTVVASVESATSLTLSAPPEFSRSGTTASIGARDSGIDIVGGDWRRYTSVFVEPSDNSYHTFLIRRVDGFRVLGATMGSGAGKYMIHLADVIGFEVDRLTLVNAPSDGVHIGGACFGGRISRVRGRTGDDIFAITAADYLQYNDVYGDVSDVKVEDVKYTSANAPGRFLLSSDSSSLSLSSLQLRRIELRGVGTEKILSTQSQQLGKVLMSGVLSGVKIADTGCVIVNDRDGGTLGTMWLNDLEVSRWSSNFSYPDFAAWLAQPFGRVVIDGWELSETSTSQRYGIILGKSGGTPSYGRLVVRNCTANVHVIRLVSQLYPGSTIDLVKIENTKLTATLAAGNSRLVDVGGSCVASRISLSDTVTSGTTWDVSHGGSGACSLVLQNAQLSGTNSVRLANTPVVSIDATSSTLTTPTVGASASLSAQSFGVRCDVSALSKTANSVAYNTNASLSCGVGPVVCNGVTWKHLYSGATY